MLCRVLKNDQAAGVNEIIAGGAKGCRLLMGGLGIVLSQVCCYCSPFKGNKTECRNYGGIGWLSRPGRRFGRIRREMQCHLVPSRGRNGADFVFSPLVLKVLSMAD